MADLADDAVRNPLIANRDEYRRAFNAWAREMRPRKGPVKDSDLTLSSEPVNGYIVDHRVPGDTWQVLRPYPKTGPSLRHCVATCFSRDAALILARALPAEPTWNPQ